ncbi:MAG: hypothetical protein VX641_03910 [Planctomycetota bacterium]|nr:hypothetical protein [Planctomycetota bacterium]
MTRTGIAAGLGCLMACSGQAVADIQIDVGCFSNVNPVPACEYEGDYAAFITSWEVEGYTSTQGYTMIDIDIAGIMAAAGENHLRGVTIQDFGTNSYGALSPGADIDFIDFIGLDQGVEVVAGYQGPTSEHAGQSSSQLWDRLGSLDAFYGANHVDDDVYVSLGDLGSLELEFAGIGGGDQGGGGGGGGGGAGGIDPWSGLASSNGLHLRIAEVGSHEQFSIHLHTSSIPAPGVLLVLSSGLGMHRRRRR